MRTFSTLKVPVETAVVERVTAILRTGFLLLLTILFAIVSASEVSAGDFPSGKISRFIEKAMDEFRVPGAAVAVVKDGKVLLCRGYGIKKIGETERVDEHTLFAIASNTKAFTATALALLVDEGKIDWNDRVIDYLPDFQMYDPYVTREMRIEDLLTHRCGLGLGAGDLLFWPQTSFTTREIIRRIRYIKPATSFRTTYAYCNLMFVVAGEIIPAVTGESWASFVEERIFKPLDMTESKTIIHEFTSEENLATPHVLVDGRLIPVEYMDIENTAPAGAINSCAADMAKWVIVLLNRGLIGYDEKGGEVRLFSEERSRDMWSSHIPIPIRDYPEPIRSIQPNFSAYGYGFRLNDYRGYKMVSHGGALLGTYSMVTMLPDLRAGVVVLTNQESSAMMRAVTFRVLDYFLGGRPKDWISAFRRAEEIRIEKAAELEKKNAAKRVRGTKPSLSLDKYAGVYEDAWRGKVSVEYKGGRLTMRFSNTDYLVGELEHWHYDTFIVRWRDRTLKGDAFVTFWLNHSGEIDHVTMLPVSPLTDFSFDFKDLYLVPAEEEGRAAR